MLKYILISVLFLLFQSCQVTETIILNNDGSGTIEISKMRDEQNYMSLLLGKYNEESPVHIDTTTYFKDVLQNKNMERMSDFEQKTYRKYEKVSIHEVKNTTEKIFKTSYSAKFENINLLPDLYKSDDYADNIIKNYALSAEKHS